MPTTAANHAFSLDALYAAASGPTPRRMTREPQQIEVALEARETEWELKPGLRVAARDRRVIGGDGGLRDALEHHAARMMGHFEVVL